MTMFIQLVLTETEKEVTMRGSFRRLTTVFLAVLMLSTATAFAVSEGLENFVKTKTYDGRFQDMLEG